MGLFPNAATADVGPPEIATLVLAALIWAELVGVSVAWLKLRKTAAWESRPPDVRRIDLLSRYVGGITALAGLWAGMVVLVALGISAMS
jgi:hypothetical protein